MKTLKELKEKCNLIAEYKNTAFKTKYNDILYYYKTPIKTALYGDNKGNYYHYKYIRKGTIIEYDDYKLAIKNYMEFIKIMLEDH